MVEKPDPAGARETADTALRLRPDWFYVREVLRPQIEKALDQRQPGK
jgi:hypothetical protein